MIKERHGIANCKRAGNVLGDDEQAVHITDGVEYVFLGKTSSDSAALTPDQADMLADMLRDAAARVRARGKID